MTRKSILTPMVGAAVTAGLLLAPEAAVAKTATQTQQMFQPAPDKNGKPGLGIATGVSPAPPAGERVAVKYFKRANGQWVLRAAHHPKLNKDGLAQTRFYPKATHGTCKVTGRYPGDDKYAGSRAKMVF